MIRILITLLMLSSSLLYAQTQFDTYSWNTLPVKNNADTITCVNGMKTTLERRITEIYANKEGNFEEIAVFHKKVKVETHKALNEYNKIYVPIDNVIEVLAIKARFIGADGKITELPQESIKQVDNLENKGDYKTLAVEGAVVGGEIEHYYVLRKKFKPFGSVYIQNDEPKTNVEVMFIYPAKIEYLFKSHNEFPDFATSELDKERTLHNASIDFIPALKEEKYANYQSNLMRYEYTLAYNTYNTSLRVYSWNQAANNIYSNLYELSKTEKAAVKKQLKTLNITGKSTEDALRIIENWVKSDVVISDEIKETLPLDQIIRIRQTSKQGATRLTLALITEAGIPSELVLTSNNEKRPFDPMFNGWNYLDEFLIYLPELNQIIVPDDPTFRLGIMPDNYSQSFALFLHPISYNEKLKTLGYDIRRLPGVNYKNNIDSLNLNLTINLNNLTLDASIHRVFKGEIARNFQSFWNLLNDSRKKEVLKEIYDMGNQNTIIGKFSTQNASMTDIGINPLIWNIEATANSLVELAGDDVIVKIGETIGRQSELYQDTERTQPVNMGTLTNYCRTITLNIPEGYKLENASDLLMNVTMMNDGKISCAFTSDYKLVGNKLIIISKEYYTEPNLPIEKFEDFRKVINAAADFNKKTVLLTKI